MSQSLFHLVLLIAGFGQFVTCDNVPAQAASPIVDEYSGNWTYKAKEMGVAVVRMWFRPREFTFATHDTSKDYCVVSFAKTDASNPSMKTCNYHFRDTEGEKVTIENIYSYEPNGRGISLSWHTPKLKARHTVRSGSINMEQCPNRGSAPENPESTTSEAAQNESESSTATEDVANEEENDVIKDYSWVSGIEGPIEINSTEGIVFLGQKNETDSKVQALFMEMPSNETRVLEDIGSLAIPKDETRSSRAHGKFGQCYMMTPTRMSCSLQRLMNGHPWMSILQTTLDFPDGIDWFTLTNLKENSILLAHGKCSGNMCNSYTIRKLTERGENKVLVNVDNLGVKCEDAYRHLTNDIVDYIRDSQFCFHLVCTRHHRSGEEPGVTMQYRRHCIKRDVITSWG